MLIGKVVKENKVQASFKFDQSLHDDLAEYKEFYVSTYGEEVSNNVIVEELLKVVLQKDKAFQKFKKEKSKSVE